MRTRDRLAQALKEVNAPSALIEKAEAGFYDDFESPIATPALMLVNDLKHAHLDALAERAMSGEFDATREEADAWAESEEGRQIIGELGKLKP